MKKKNTEEKLPNVLYVEDHLQSYKMVKLLLKNKCKLINAISVDEAMNLLKEQKIEIILLDISLQKKEDGLELITRIKPDSKLKEIPIIAVTAHAMAGDEKHFLKAGVDEYLSKPFTEDALVSLVEKCLAKVKK